MIDLNGLSGGLVMVRRSSFGERLARRAEHGLATFYGQNRIAAA